MFYNSSILATENIILTEDGMHMELMQTSFFSPVYWSVVVICGVIWFLGALPAFRDSDIMHLFKGIAKFAFMVLIILYFAITYWI